MPLAAIAGVGAADRRWVEDQARYFRAQLSTMSPERRGTSTEEIWTEQAERFERIGAVLAGNSSLEDSVKVPDLFVQEAKQRGPNDGLTLNLRWSENTIGFSFHRCPDRQDSATVKWIPVARELIPDLREWSEPVQVMIAGDEMKVRRIDLEGPK